MADLRIIFDEKGKVVGTLDAVGGIRRHDVPERKIPMLKQIARNPRSEIERLIRLGKKQKKMVDEQYVQFLDWLLEHFNLESELGEMFEEMLENL